MEINVADYQDDDIVLETKTEREENTILDSLKNELQRVVKNEPVALNVPSRPNMVVKFDTNIEAKQIQMWRKACNNKSLPDNFDSLKFSSIIIANQATEIIYKGEIIVDEKGDLLNFKNPAFLDMLGAIKALDGVRKLYGIDGHIFIAADEIMRAAGYDSESQETQADPTLIS